MIWNLLSAAIVALPCILLTWFSLEVFAGLRAKEVRRPYEGKPCSFVVIVPAHDESLVIERALAGLLRVVDAPSSVLVVADNCADDTADLARSAGVRVAERRDPECRGKGYALAYARDALAASPPDAVMVLDADCMITRGKPQELCSHAVQSDCAVQAENLQHALPDSSPLVRIGAFAFFVMNVIRAAGLERVGGSALLQGTGMAFPWTRFAALDLASGDSVEDLGMSLQLIRQGVPVRLDPQCAVASYAGSAHGHLEQRRRWELGFLSKGFTHGLSLLGEGVVARKRLMAAAGAHLLVPPLALLFLVAGLAFAMSLTLHLLLDASWLPVLALGLTGFVAAIAVLASWLIRGRDIVPLGTLAAAPLYAFWKIPMYLKLGSPGGREWNRGERVKAPDRTGET